MWLVVNRYTMSSMLVHKEPIDNITGGTIGLQI